MAYATSSDIASEFKGIEFTTTSTVKAAEVTAFIEEEESVINATISNRYEVPVTGTEAKKFLKNISVAYVAFRVAKILNLKKDVPIPEKFVPQVLNEGAKYKEAKQLLYAVRDGKIILGDATALSTGQGVKSYNSENSILPQWERDTKQW
jgi:hypothetical protein